MLLESVWFVRVLWLLWMRISALLDLMSVRARIGSIIVAA